MLVSEDPRKVILALQRKFERPDHVIRLLLSKIRKHETLKDGDYIVLCDFVDTVRHYVAVVETLRKPSYLHNSIVLDELVQKLTEPLQMKWTKNIMERDLGKLSLKDFMLWISLSSMCGEAYRYYNCEDVWSCIDNVKRGIRGKD